MLQLDHNALCRKFSQLSPNGEGVAQSRDG